MRRRGWASEMSPKIPTAALLQFLPDDVSLSNYVVPVGYTTYGSSHFCDAPISHFFRSCARSVCQRLQNEMQD